MVQNYIDGLYEEASQLPNGKRFKARIDFMNHICQALSNDELPKYHFPTFQLSEKDFRSILADNMDLNEQNFQDLVKKLEKFDHDLREFRTYLQVRFGYWATITQDLMQKWVELFPNKKYLEIMAGNGYISKGFQDLGVTSICTDNQSWSNQSRTGIDTLVKVERFDALDAIDEYALEVDAVVLAWSPDRVEIDYDILQKTKKLGLDLFVIGEKYGATNSKKFWDNASFVDNQEITDLNKLYSQYDLVHDKIYLVK